MLIGTALAITGNVTDDQPGKARMQRLERQAHACGGARREVLHQHVGLGQQVVEHLRGLVLLEVESQALLGAVGPDEMGGDAGDALVVAAGEVSHARALHLDHPGAEIGQLAGAERCCDGVLQTDHRDAVKGTD
ncbi:hypothetical protein FQZ97_809700 [compost metagenome]